MLMDVKTYWEPLSEGKIKSSTYSELRKHGLVFELMRPRFFITRFLLGNNECGIQTAFDVNNKSIILRIPNVGTYDAYLTQENKELEEIKKQKEHSKRALSEHMSELKRSLLNNLNLIHVTEREIRYARADRLGIPPYEQKLFEHSLDEILNKYFLEPE